VRPVRTVEVLDALRRSRGGVAVVPEAEIVAALAGLGRLGLFVEPTAATAAAAFEQLLHEGKIRREETTVVVLTGHGLKATDKIAELLGLYPPACVAKHGGFRFAAPALRRELRLEPRRGRRRQPSGSGYRDAPGRP
jgi:threonine synthase